MRERGEGMPVGGGKDGLVRAGKTSGEGLSHLSARTDKKVEGGWHRRVRE